MTDPTQQPTGETRRCWACGRFARIVWQRDGYWGGGRFVWRHGRVAHPLSTAR